MRRGRWCQVEPLPGFADRMRFGVEGRFFERKNGFGSKEQIGIRQRFGKKEALHFVSFLHGTYIAYGGKACLAFAVEQSDLSPL